MSHHVVEALKDLIREVIAETEPAAAPAAPAKADKPAKGKKAKKPEVTIEELRDGLTELVKSKGKEAAKAVLAEVGAAKLTDVDEAQYAELQDLITAKQNEEEEDAGADDDLFGDD